MAALVLAARTARAQVVAADVGVRVRGPVTPVLDPTALGRSRVLELPWPLRLKTRRHRTARGCTRPSGVGACRVRAAALRSGLATAGGCGVSSPTGGGVPASLAGASLAGAALPLTALARPTLLTATALTLAALTRPALTRPGPSAPIRRRRSACGRSRAPPFGASRGDVRPCWPLRSAQHDGYKASGS